MRLVNGWQFPDADTFMANAIRANGQYDRFVYQIGHLEAALRHVTNHACAIDGGAHVGTWARVMASSFTRVIACEPSPDTFACLDLNLRDTPVERLNVALGDHAGSVSMALLADQAARGNTGARYVQDGGTVPMVTIDSLHIESLGLLKLDVEGSEYVALKGATATLQRCRPIVLFEDKKLWHKHYGLSKDAVSRFLTGVGYRHLERISMDEIWGPA